MTSGQKKSARPKKPCSAGGRRGGDSRRMHIHKSLEDSPFFVKTVDSVLKKTRTVLYKM